MKDQFISRTHPEIIEGPRSLKIAGREKIWKSAIQALVADEPRFRLTSFTDRAAMENAAHRLLRDQVKKLRLRKPATVDLGAKRTHEDFEEQPSPEQAIVPPHLPSPDFPIALWKAGVPLPVVGNYTKLFDIANLDDWVSVKSGITSGSVKIDAVVHVWNEDYFHFFDTKKPGERVILHVSDQVAWDSVVTLAQQSAKEPTRFPGIRLEVKEGEPTLGWNRRNSTGDGPDPKRPKRGQHLRGDNNDSDENDGGNGNDSFSEKQEGCSGHERPKPTDPCSWGDDSGDSGDSSDSDVVVDPDAMQEILGLFCKEVDQKPPPPRTLMIHLTNKSRTALTQDIRRNLIPAGRARD